MFGSVVLEVALGIVLTFLLFSIILTAAKEALESVLKSRSSDLEKAIAELLSHKEDGSAASPDILNQFYSHPLIFSLFRGGYENARKSRKLPSYIPSANFAGAVQSLWGASHEPLEGILAKPDPGNNNASDKLKFKIQSVIAHMGDSAKSEREKLELWFNTAMDRLTGHYKRKTQTILFVCAFAMAAIGNINPILIGNRLVNDAKLRTEIVALAPNVAQAACPKGAMSCGMDQQMAARFDTNFKEEGMPIGWGSAPDMPSLPDLNKPFEQNMSHVTPSYIIALLLGWMVTAFAGMLGAPFWFDMMSKVINLRNSLKPEDKPKGK